MVTMDDGRAWSDEFAALLERWAPRFGRVEPRRRAAAYLKGLLAPVERKNGWQLAEAAGDRTPDGVQEFLGRVRWGARARCATICGPMSSRIWVILAACWFWTRPALSRRVSKSAGVQRQYSGTAGRIENCQIGVFLAYASRHGRALIDRALYLPEVWARTGMRRAEAGIPGEVRFLTKPKLGLAMLERAHAAGVPFAPAAACGSRSCRDGSAAGRWVTADSVYGADHVLRRWLQEHRLGYVLAVTKAQRLGFGRVEDRVGELPPASWHRLSAGDGAMIGSADHPSPRGAGAGAREGGRGSTTGPIWLTPAPPPRVGRGAC